ncbi:RTX toxin [Allorhizobium ampelinum]|uniref:Rhizobiocin/RTX toxin n=2 Tax=Rhizobium/Agrobacterium group TaxID=227290 RepID=B9K4D8_ALLAM|nr:rhizobiocin/RTX toxin [Allorhizobium ampelinum S4]OVE87302.1 RTX toxin [Allorhizobium ampelinum]
MFTLTLACLAPCFGWAEETPTVPPANLAVQILNFDAANPTVPWIRPPEVQFVLLSGCGGGGGGGTTTVTGSGSNTNRVPGKGGGAARLYTIIVPVKADRYDITIGDGGGSAANGMPTTMTGAGAGAAAITLGGGQQGSSVSADGEASPFGPGGKGGTSVAEASGKNPCSGGGGSAAYWTAVGGKGAPGQLTIMPIPDLARFGRVMAMVEDLSQPPKVPDDANSTSGEDEQGPVAAPGGTGSLK